jgi:oligopeptidase B
VPPVAPRRPVRLTQHGIERIDEYAWLRDVNWREAAQNPARLDPEICAHLEAENAYAAAVLAPLASLRARLIDELKGRLDPDDSGVPSPDGPYAYWEKYVPGGEHVRIMRAPAGGGAEELLLDAAVLAAGRQYFSLGSYRHSPDHRLYAYQVDETGSEAYTLRIRDLASGRDLPDVLSGTADFAWSADGRTLFYVRYTADHRRLLVYRHALGTDPAADVLVYEERDQSFSISLDSLRSNRFIALSTGSRETSEVRLIDAARPERLPVLIAARQRGVRYYLDDWNDQLVILTNSEGAEDFKIVTAPVAAPGRESWRDLVPYREGREIMSALPFADHLARVEREDANLRIVIRRKSDGAEHVIAFPEEAFSLRLLTGYEFNTAILRFVYSSPATPEQQFDYDMETRERVLRKQDRVPSGHDPSRYTVRRLYAVAADGERIPITVLHRKDVALDGSAPLFLNGYGAYAYSNPASFDSNRLSLIERGFIFAIAHVRGGGEKGTRWHQAGYRESKVNTFTDFIAVAEYLVQAGYGSRGRIVAFGESGGGLLVGAVANMRPDLFAGMVARVPFVDAVNTILDETQPLAITEFEEWGDPVRDPAAFRRIASYSPYDNVRAQPYPHMLVTAGLSDLRVPYWEPAKWIARLRALKTNDSRMLLITQLSAGHHGAAGRFEALDEVASLLAFALDVVGLADLREVPPPAAASTAGRGCSKP